MQCHNCEELLMVGSTQLLEISEKSEGNKENLSTLIENKAENCCLQHSECSSGKFGISSKQKFLFVYFTEATNLKIVLKYNLFGNNFKYKCHIREVDTGFQTHFLHQDLQFFDDNGTIDVSSNTDYEKSVKLIILSRLESVNNATKEDETFPNRALVSIRKKNC